MAVFHPILFILAGNVDMHESSDEFEFQPDWTEELGALERKKNPHRLIMGKNDVSLFLNCS